MKTFRAHEHENILRTVYLAFCQLTQVLFLLQDHITSQDTF